MQVHRPECCRRRARHGQARVRRRHPAPPGSTRFPAPRSTPIARPAFAGPYIVKPRFGGSSIGIEITDDLSAVGALVRTSPHYRSGAVIEPYLADAVDLNISVLTHPALRLSAIERPLRGDARIYSYADKYLGGEGMASAKRELPASVPESGRDCDHRRREARRSRSLWCARWPGSTSCGPRITSTSTRSTRSPARWPGTSGRARGKQYVIVLPCGRLDRCVLLELPASGLARLGIAKGIVILNRVPVSLLASR